MTKYIGARYMPKFVGVYDATQAYEALSVVDNGSGTSYVSNQPVPVGTPLTDTTYWAVYGSTNGAILNLQQQIDDMKDGTVSGSLQDQINDNSSDITALENTVNNIDLPFKHSTFLMMGDSYAAHSGWVTAFTSLMDGATVIDQTEGSRTFVSNYTYLDKLQTYVAGATAATLEGIDYLILLGGIGDSHPSTNSGLGSAIGDFITYAKQHLPNAKIYLGYIGGGLCGYGGPGDPGDATPMARIRAMATYESSANGNDSYYISGINNVLNNYRWYHGSGMDGLHPQSSSGIGYYIANYLYNYLATGSAKYAIADVNTMNIGNTSNVKIESFQDDSITELKIGAFAFTLNAAIGQNGTDAVKICTLPLTCPIWGSDLIDKAISVYVYDGSTDELAPLSFYIYKRELYVTSIQRRSRTQFWDIPSTTTFDVPELLFRMDTAMVLKEKYNVLG